MNGEKSLRTLTDILICIINILLSLFFPSYVSVSLCSDMDIIKEGDHSGITSVLYNMFLWVVVVRTSLGVRGVRTEKHCQLANSCGFYINIYGRSVQLINAQSHELQVCTISTA